VKQFSLIVSFLTFLFLSSPAYATISLTISNFEKVNDYFSIDVTLSGAASDSSYFIQAMFTKPESPNYLGFTWGQKGDWIKYVSSPETDYIKTNFPILENNNTQKILLRPDTDDSGYKGPGEYLVKVKRYTQGGSSTASDNSLTVTLAEATPTQEVSPTQDPTTSPTPTSVATATSTPTSTPTNTSAPTATKTSTSSTTNTPTSTQTKTPTPSSSLRVSSSSQSNLTPLTTSVTPSTTFSPTENILGEATTLSAQPEDISPTIVPDKPSSGSNLNRILIIIGLILVIPASALYFFSDKVKIA